MKINILKLLLLCSNLAAYCQYWELGAGIATTNNRTDVSNFNILNSRIGADAFFRYNFNHVWVFRGDIKYLMQAANDSYNSDILSKVRNYSFRTNVFQISANVEYNFLDYRDLKRKVRFSPYLTAGLGVAIFSLPPDFINPSQVPVYPTIPFGFGVKYMIDKNWNIGAKYECSVLYTDKLDGLDGSNPGAVNPHFRSADLANNDWMHYFGINISYTFYKIKCPPHHDLLIKDSVKENAK